MRFEWDEVKEQKNIEKHGINFETAALVFGDENRIEKYDVAHSLEEDRYITIGCVDGILTVLMVVYTERRDAIRIISARVATKKEEVEYYEECRY